MAPSRQPSPRNAHRSLKSALGCAAKGRKGLQLVLPGPSQQSSHQLLLGAEEVEEDPGTGSYGGGEGTKRCVGQPVFQHVSVGELEQIGLAWRGGGSYGVHAAMIT